MYFDFTTIAAFFLLLTSASSAPTGQSLQGACAAVQSSSLELNKIARLVSLEARNGSKDLTNVSSTLAWMEAKDNCDPTSLKKESGTCIKKIFAVLGSYNFEVNTVGEFSSCSKFASKVKPALRKLHTDMKKCVDSRRGVNQQEESHVNTQPTTSQPTGDWKEALLCHYTMDRLFSFSILTARVFALGDPANHSEGSAEKCI